MYKGIALLCVIVSISIGLVYAKSERMRPEQVEVVSELSVNNLKEAINIIKNEYVRKVSEDKLVEAAINGMLVSLDPHSSFYNKKEILNEKNLADIESGIGLEIATDSGSVRVVTPVEGGPADKAGIKAGDYIMTINDISVYGMSSNEVIQKISGKPNSEVKLTIFREGVSPSLEFKLKRENITVRPAVVDYVDDNVVYIRISSFDDYTYSSIEKTLRKMIKQKQPAGVILDLRNNPGGLISEAVRISSMFMDNVTVVYTRGRDDSSMAEYHSDNNVLKVHGVPVVVLINNGTASAAEIVAGALQDHKKAVVLGTRSFGKGSVQDMIPLEGNAVMNLTTALYYTPTGRSIQAEGVMPDIIVEDIEIKKFREDHTFREENIEGHLESVKDMNQSKGSYIVEKIKKRIDNNKNKPCTMCKNDYMIIRAVDLVKGISIYKLTTSKK